MTKTLIAAAIAGAFAFPMVASAQGDNIVVAQDTSSSNKQPGVNPPGATSPGSPSSTVTSTDRETGAAARANPSGAPDSAAAGGTAAGNFDRLDKNRDGFVSRDEAKDASELNTRFTELDRNNDGKLSREEYGAITQGSAGATTSGSASTSSMGSGGVQGSAPVGKGPGAQESATRSTGDSK
jgi:hypothetical protein